MGKFYNVVFIFRQFGDCKNPYVVVLKSRFVKGFYFSIVNTNCVPVQNKRLMLCPIGHATHPFRYSGFNVAVCLVCHVLLVSKSLNQFNFKLVYSDNLLLMICILLLRWLVVAVVLKLLPSCDPKLEKRLNQLYSICSPYFSLVLNVSFIIPLS